MLYREAGISLEKQRYVIKLLQNLNPANEAEVRPLTSHSSAVFIIFNVTGISEQGNEYIKTDIEHTFSTLMTRLEDLIKYYLETGSMKRTPNLAASQRGAQATKYGASSETVDGFSPPGLYLNQTNA